MADHGSSLCYLMLWLVAVVACAPGVAMAEGADGRPAPVTRDAAYWPFASDSPWNMPLGSEAEYESISSPGFRPDGGASLNVESWSHPVFVGTRSDPLRSFYSGSRLVSQVNTPADAKPDAQSDGNMHVVDATHHLVTETWRARKRADGNWRAPACVLNDLYGSGFYDRWHGVRAGGMSAVGGLVRKHELEQGDIPHVLAVAVRPKALNRRAPGGKAWVWPASWADGTTNPGEIYGTEGNLYMGSLVAIPPHVELASLGLSSQGLVIARALQDYGAIVCDTGDANVAYYAEPAAAPQVSRSVYADIGKLSNYLQVIRNNTAASVGGGGTRRRAAAPPLK